VSERSERAVYNKTNIFAKRSGAMISIIISAFMTGLTSAMMAFDLDTSEKQRQKQPMFYGFIKNGSDQRGRTYFLMTMMSTMHNLSRSLGYAILAVSDKNLALRFFVGEVGLYHLYKVFRKDYFCQSMIDGKLSGFLVSFLASTLVKVVADFSVSKAKQSVKCEPSRANKH